MTQKNVMSTDKIDGTGRIPKEGDKRVTFNQSFGVKSSGNSSFFVVVS